MGKHKVRVSESHRMDFPPCMLCPRRFAYKIAMKQSRTLAIRAHDFVARFLVSWLVALHRVSGGSANCLQDPSKKTGLQKCHARTWREFGCERFLTRRNFLDSLLTNRVFSTLILAAPAFFAGPAHRKVLVCLSRLIRKLKLVPCNVFYVL